MKNTLSKQLIDGIVRNDNTDFVDSVDGKVEQLVRESINDLSKMISYVNTKNVVLQPANELLNGAMTDNSNFVYFLGVDNVQIDLNTRKSAKFWKDLKDRIIYAWYARGSTKRAQKRLKKASEKLDKKQISFDPSKYNIFDLAADLQQTFSKYLTKTSLIYMEGNRLRIVGKEDFGSNTQIIIYITIFDGEKFKYFRGRKEGYLDLDFSKRINALNEKIEKVGNVYIDLIKVYNVLYFETNNMIPNQIFVESLLWNVPDELFDDSDAYKTFVKIVNFFTIKSIKNFKSIASNQPLFNDKVCGNCAFGHSKLLNKLNELKS